MSEREVPANIIGGPLCTRTAERSLQVNLLPTRGGQLCRLDCVYCPFPRNHPLRSWRTPGDVGAAVTNALRSDREYDSIAISGPGDPTLHPEFGRALGDVLWARQQRPQLPVRILTSANRACDPHVRRLLRFADECLVRIDAGGDRIERPDHSVSREQIAAALRELPAFSVESVFVDGPAGNTNERDVEDWISQLAELRPTRVTVTTIAHPPLDPELSRADPATLERISAELRERTGIATVVVP
jgi:wyosine [tRNA(Phe)-imidazoG37] synthetase (radical SAM superfamily)